MPVESATTPAHLIKPDTRGSSLTIKMQEDKPFPFMKLPVELREKVYSEFLVSPNSVIFDASTRPRLLKYVPKETHSIKQHKKDAASLFATSRAVYHEATPTYFGLNTFHFNTLDKMARVLSVLRLNLRRSIRSISVDFIGTTPAKATRLLAQCVGLRHLTLTFDFGSRNLSQGRTRMITLCGVKDLLHLRGLKTLKLELEPPLLHYYTQFWDTFPELGAALQILKQPHDPAFLAKMQKKDDRIAKKAIRRTTPGKQTRKN